MGECSFNCLEINRGSSRYFINLDDTQFNQILINNDSASSMQWNLIENTECSERRALSIIACQITQTPRIHYLSQISAKISRKSCSTLSNSPIFPIRSLLDDADFENIACSCEDSLITPIQWLKNKTEKPADSPITQIQGPNWLRSPRVSNRPYLQVQSRSNQTTNKCTAIYIPNQMMTTAFLFAFSPSLLLLFVTLRRYSHTRRYYI